jgi:hypothetical protein
MTAFNLRHLAQEVMRTSKSADYADIAAEVLAQIPPRELRAALAQSLPTFVRTVSVSQRQPGAVRPPSPAPKMPGSWKVQAIREGWQRRLSEIYSTESGNKRLGDFTRDDLLHQSAICEQQAKQKHSKAKGWRNLADLMDAERVEVVRDLPAEILMTTLGAVA